MSWFVAVILHQPICPSQETPPRIGPSRLSESLHASRVSTRLSVFCGMPAEFLPHPGVAIRVAACLRRRIFIRVSVSAGSESDTALQACRIWPG